MGGGAATRATFGQALARGALVLDGAMGTALYERGVLYSNSFDSLCLSQPELVGAVHRSYLDAGAVVLGTNSFGANRMRLALHDLQDQAADISRAAVVLAREVAGDRAHVLGSVGPTGRPWKTLGEAERPEVTAAYREQIGALLEAGVDALLLETFRQPEELAVALQVALELSAGGCPVVASVSFDPFGTMADGTGPEAMAQRLAEAGADALGVNCADGPAGVYEMATRMLGPGLPVLAQPNAGLPQRVDGRFAYMATPEYFQLYARRLFKAGIHGVGGCCGTTPEHIRKIAAAARMVAGEGEAGDGGGMRDEEPMAPKVAPGIQVVPREQKGAIGAKLGRDFLVSVEVNPPPGLSLDRALEGARLLRDGGVDMINVADGPRASARMGNLALCVRAQQELQMPALMHVTTRDRNLLGLIAHLLAGHELGVHNLVVITGDPPKMGDFPDATPVYDVDSVGLLRIIDGLNRGIDPGGKPLMDATRFLCATGAEPAAVDYDREIRRLEAKARAGADYVMTQPVYDIDVLERFLDDTERIGLPTLVGLLPLASHRNAEFLHNEVPGMRVPEAIRERMRAAGSGPSARAEGVQVAREMLLRVRDRVAGAYIMPPFGRYKLALDVIKGIVR
ncbi:MAG: bifunctional homocysteine S-methyltransferase/methylenetetrahydrofolate reductase [Myxococcales bacterium]|nr:bifunctional homocysteine S-methyltransferase/methylenetetrahydrofolate reductase [Myxococcales bacterium]